MTPPPRRCACGEVHDTTVIDRLLRPGTELPQLADADAWAAAERHWIARQHAAAVMPVRPARKPNQRPAAQAPAPPRWWQPGLWGRR